MVFVSPAAVAKSVVGGGYTKATHDFVDAIRHFRQLWSNLFSHVPCDMVTATAKQCKFCHAACSSHSDASDHLCLTRGFRVTGFSVTVTSPLNKAHAHVWNSWAVLLNLFVRHFLYTLANVFSHKRIIRKAFVPIAV